jgi:RNA polymerase sigma-70 factor, ECF subfamily
MTKRGAALEEIEDVYRRRLNAFVRTATAIVGDATVAEDVVHDAFVSAVRSRKDFRREGAVETWLWRVVVNTARSRRRKELQSAISSAPQFQPAQNGRSDSESGWLRKTVAALPERQRLALFLRYYADLDYAGIAAVLGVAPGTAAATLHSAHRAVRAYLEEVRA